MAEYVNPKQVKDELLASLANAAEMQQPTQEDYYQLMGQVYYLLKDEEVMNLVTTDPDLCKLIPAISHLVRTSNIDTDKNGRKVSAIMKIRNRRALRIQLLVNKTPNLRSQALFDAMTNFCDSVVEDMKGGWRGRLVTERIKTYRFETAEKQKQGLFQRIFGSR